jgi:multiple inositol-polyphosphate phosphatase/2,3-bisphosphoglycerate 3-phosphatase
MVTGVLRHGSRNPGKKDIRLFDELERKFQAASAQQLPAELRSWMPTWKNPYKMADSHLLVAAGVAEHVGIASRLRRRFPHLFESYHSRRHRFRSSCHERAARSAHAFAQGLFPAGGSSGAAEGGGSSAWASTQLEAYHITTPDCLGHVTGEEMGGREVGEDGQGHKGDGSWLVDRLTRFFDSCPKYHAAKEDINRERRAFLHAADMQGVRAGLNQRLAAGGVQLSAEEVAAVYTLCGFEVAHWNATDGACSLFAKEEEAEVLEYLEDLKHWYKKSYGLALNGKMACPLHAYLLQRLALAADQARLTHHTHQPQPDPHHRQQQQAAAGAAAVASDLIFAHGETLVPLLTRLGMFADAHALTADLPSPLRDKRAFRTKGIMPMAANLLFVLHQCSNASSSLEPQSPSSSGAGAWYVVLTLHNERAVALAACAHRLWCPLHALVDHFVAEAANDAADAPGGGRREGGAEEGRDGGGGRSSGGVCEGGVCEEAGYSDKMVGSSSGAICEGASRELCLLHHHRCHFHDVCGILPPAAHYNQERAPQHHPHPPHYHQHRPPPDSTRPHAAASSWPTSLTHLVDADGYIPATAVALALIAAILGTGLVIVLALYAGRLQRTI